MNSSQEGNFRATSCNIYYCWSKQEQGGTPAVAPLVAFFAGKSTCNLKQSVPRNMISFPQST